jgi:hypothetical protein
LLRNRRFIVARAAQPKNSPIDALRVAIGAVHRIGSWNSIRE